jgi:hypothetical protein
MGNPRLEDKREDQSVIKLIIYSGLLAWLTGGARNSDRTRPTSFDGYVEDAKKRNAV